jgi:hypothetical protein
MIRSPSEPARCELLSIADTFEESTLDSRRLIEPGSAWDDLSALQCAAGRIDRSLQVKSMRVTRDVELEGLDVPEFGLLSYPEDALVSES